MNSVEVNIVLFDGACNLCNRAVQFIIRNDSNSNFKFASLQSNNAHILIERFGITTENIHSLVYIRDNRIYQKSTAVLKILNKLGGCWQILYVLIIIPPFIRNAFYDFVAKQRYKWFGKSDTCMIPPPKFRERFFE